ncbi:IPT/TIG domain protein [Paenisporosarcina sp. FSL H8-0542]|uniref:PKD domain-containing protein n=1 Tax=Paenisporosarcina sp. FSL H8-0542 TaxID=2921401 RepID=UPI00315A1B3A
MTVGPINAFDGFPVWYKDENRLRLQLNVDPTDPYSGITPADLPNPTLPVSFPDNYPSEAFYFLAEAEMTTGTGERARLVLALEAAFVSEVPRDGDQIVFGRVRIRIFGLQPNAEYTVTHPYGTDTFIAEPDGEGAGEINFTEDIGGFNGGEFELALNSRVHPFLKWDPNVAPLAPEGYIGDPNVPHPITGSVFVDSFGQPQNIFRIEGPGIGIGSPDRSTTPGLDPDNCIETRLFTVLGKISTVSGVDVTRANYTQTDSARGLLDVFAVSDDTAQTISASGNGIDTTLLQGINGRYFARVAYTGDRPPASVTVTNLSDVPNSIKEAGPVDFITATANYDTNSQTLDVIASSSDLIGAPALSIEDFGVGEIIIPPNGLSTTSLPFAPSQVTIKSTAGGKRVIDVSVTGSPDGPIPVEANAGPDQTVVVNSTVFLNGTNSSGAITSYNWIQLSGPTVALTGGTTATPTFVAPASQATLVFELTVDGEGGPSTDSVSITVLDSTPPPIADAGPDQVVQQGAIVTLAGSATGLATSYQWAQISGVPVQLTNPNTSTATYRFPAQPATLTFQLTVQGPGGISSDTVQVTSVPETLTVTRAEYRTGDAEWRISGTSNVLQAGASISIYIGSSLNGTLLVQVPVDTLGEWGYRVEGSSQLPDQTRAISIQSSSGGTLQNIPLNIRN